ncbi:acyl-CoA dehydrogenase [Rhodococcus koreensis]
MTRTGATRERQNDDASKGSALGSAAETDEQQRFAHSVAGAIARTWKDDDLRAVGLGDRTVDEEAHWDMLVESGLPAVPIPEEHGGFGGYWIDVVAALEKVGCALLPNPLAASYAATVLLAHSAEHGAGLLARTAAGRIRTTVAADCTASDWTDAGSHAVVIDSPGTLEIGGRTTVTGTLTAVLRPTADIMLVPAGTPDGTVVVVVDAKDCAIDSRTGLDLLRVVGSVRFDAAPAVVLLDASTSALALTEAHAAAVLALSAEQVGACRRSLDRAVEHAIERRQFGKQIGSFQAVAHRLSDVFVETELARAGVRHLATVLDAGGAPTEAARMTHHQTVRALKLASASGIQVLGGIGFTWESTAHHCFRKAGAASSLLGPASAPSPDQLGHRADTGPRFTGPAADLDEFIRRELPLHRAEWRNDDSFAARRAWQQRMHAGGWVAPGWPVTFGGRGLSVREQVECERVLAAAGTPMLAGVLGVNNVGPTLMALGTAAQQEHLTRILSSEEVWCQGFSEPDSGSDLASLRCRARRVGDEFVIAGQKIWTTDGMDATHIELMVRTDPDSTRHAGISVLLVPLDTPGIIRRPIVQMDGTTGFAEMFFDDVRVPVTALVGGEGEGWSVSRTTLSYERTGVVVLAARLQQAVRDVVDEIDHATLPTQTREALAETYTRAVLLDRYGARLLSAMEDGKTPGAEQSVVKLAWSQVTQALGEARLAAHGAAAIEPDVATASAYLRSRSATIAGGTTEIMKSIIAQRVLGLPR